MHIYTCIHTSRGNPLKTVIDWDNRCERFSESVWLCAVSIDAVCVTPCASVTACNAQYCGGGMRSSQGRRNP